MKNELKMSLNELGSKLAHFDIPIIRKPNGYFGVFRKAPIYGQFDDWKQQTENPKTKWLF